MNYTDRGDAGDWARIFDFGTGSPGNSDGNPSYILLTPRAGNNGKKIAAYLYNNGAENRFDTNVTMPTGWHHVAFTLAAIGSSTSSTVTIYLDGVNIGSGTASLNPTNLPSPTRVWVGRSQYGSDPYYAGATGRSPGVERGPHGSRAEPVPEPVGGRQQHGLAGLL